MNLALMFIMLILLLLLGVPIAYSIGGAGIVFIMLQNPVFILTAPQRVWSGVNSFTLIALPLFMLAGELMNYSGLSKRLINFSEVLVKPIKGSLAEVNVVANLIMGGISGSSVADASALGSVLIPEMEKKGYSKGFSAGLSVASSTMGMIIPPSIPMIMYSMVSGASIAKLFLSGLIPGILIAIIQVIMVRIIEKKRGYLPAQRKIPFSEVLQISKDGIFAILMPLFIVFSIAFGIATPSESAAIAVLYALIIGFLAYRELTMRDVVKALKKTASMSSSIMIIGGYTSIFTWILAIEQVPTAISNFLISSHIPAFLVFLLFDILLLILGTFLDVTPCILLITPIFLPALRSLGMNEIQFGAVLIVGMAIGLVTPPVGMCLFVGSKLSGLKISEVFKEAAPFLICNVIVLLLVTFIPFISLWLPGLFG